MKGVVFNVFEEFVQSGWGDEAFESLLDQCPLHTDEPFVGPGTYPDADLVALLTEACKQFDVDAPTALRAFGRTLFGGLHERFPKFVAGQPSPEAFLKTVDRVIHVEVRKLYRDAETPSFHCEDLDDGGLAIRYSSPRKLCFLMEGLLDGVADFFGMTVRHQQLACMHDGAAACDFEVHFHPVEC